MVSQPLKSVFRQSFSHTISQRVLSGTIFDLYAVLSNLFSQKMVSNINMFRAIIDFGILIQLNCTIVVFINCCWSFFQSYVFKLLS